MDISFAYLDAEEGRLHDAFPSMINVLKGILQFPAARDAQSEAFAANVVFFLNGPYAGGSDVVNVDTRLWSIITSMAACIPPEHPVQDSLVQALAILRRREGSWGLIPGNKGTLWKDLGGFRMETREAWDRLDPADSFLGEPIEPKDKFQRWRNFTSFNSKLCASGFCIGTYLASSQLSRVFEGENLEGEEMECHLWAASEWMIGHADLLLEEEIYRKNEMEKEGKSTKVRELTRWNLWKKRAIELAGEGESLGVGKEICDRLRRGVKCMVAAEQRSA